MRTLGIIPARGGSKGIPGKNIRELNGKPLLAYTVDAARAANLTQFVVSSEDAAIAEIATGLGAEVVVRPPDLARDNTPTLPVLQHALQATGKEFDAVVTLQPTSPLRTSEHIDRAIEMFSADPAADSLVSVVKVPHSMSPESVMVRAGAYLESFSSEQTTMLRRQDKKTFWARNGAAIYITRSEKLAEFVWGGNILAYEMDRLSSIDIDDLEDWRLAELILRSEATGHSRP